MANPTLAAGRLKTASIVLRDKFGNDARVDGVPTWAVSDSAIAAITPSDDGMSCTLMSSGRMGTAEVTVTVDADLGDGVRTLTGSALVDVVSGEVSAIALTLSEDFDSPDAPTDESDGEEPVPADEDDDLVVEEDGAEPDTDPANPTPTPNP